MKRYSLIIFLFVIVITTGCKKDFLNSQPLDRFSDEDVYKDSTLTGLFLNNLYANIPTEFGGTMRDALSDQLYSSGNVSIYQNTFAASTAPFGISGAWNNPYITIRRCNILIANIDRVPASAKFKNQTRDEARFLRALNYAYLINYFGAVPLITKAQDLDENLNVPRNSYTEVVNFIVSEMDDINRAQYLAYKYTGANIGRITIGAALALKGRVLLYAASYNNNWRAAYNAAKDLIDVQSKTGYALFSNYETMFYEANDNNSEVILDHQYKSNFQAYHVHHYNLPWGIVPPGPSALNQPTQNIVNEYEMSNGKMIGESGSNYDSARPYVNRDPRFYASILYDGSTYLGKTLDFIPGSNYNPSSSPLTTGYALKKMQDPAFNPLDLTKSYGGGQNYVLIRYAEIFLNLAEAAFHIGEIEEARTYVNRVRARPSVNMPEIPATQFTLAKIMHERNIELAFEGTRLWDIRRWRLGPELLGTPLKGISITQSGTNPRQYTEIPVLQRNFTDRLYLFPIYQAEVEKNPALLPNNQGW
ncbi:RagB/SusD family nutrient uptake outer membrane protein [Pedobacter sp. MC2016-14]|uniref:RagB/SusD family nutrient uptake outer membrane protein n=1 Tax=Pedobacter sp. MC2016-14 TaxID=2897327 RepID=UPI001E2921C0|nr:RagB/SusD family nutrient uptake outer membrane protein [Pedobacter sp. MC2016-14]MCD0488978.1 RagB/SusD family nutrient uptake outer membrane protein [Pedobacter sp. MC2016-14]